MPTAPPNPVLVISSGESTLTRLHPFGGTILLGDFAGTPPTLNVVDTSANIVFPHMLSSVGSYSLINVYGNGRLNLSGIGHSTITLEDNAKLTGTESLTYSRILINGGSGSVYAPTTVGLEFSDGEVVNAATTQGAFTLGVYSTLEFNGSVSASTSINLGNYSNLTVDRPGSFNGTINWTLNQPLETATVVGIHADAYSYANNTLSLYLQGIVVDALKINNLTGTYLVSQSSTGVQISDADLPAGSTALQSYAASAVTELTGQTLYLSKATPFTGTVELNGPGAGGALDLTNTSATVTTPYGGNGEVYVHGTDTLNISGAGGLLVNVDPGATLRGAINMNHGGVIINGGTFKPTTVDLSRAGVSIDSRVVGGDFTLGGMASASFLGPVSASTTINLTNGGAPTGVTIADPQQFHGTIDITFYFSPINVKGLVADNYVYNKDLLSFYDGQTKVDTLHVKDTSIYGLEVTHSANGIQVSAAFTPPVMSPGHVAIG